MDSHWFFFRAHPKLSGLRRTYSESKFPFMATWGYKELIGKDLAQIVWTQARRGSQGLITDYYTQGRKTSLVIKGSLRKYELIDNYWICRGSGLYKNQHISRYKACLWDRKELLVEKGEMRHWLWLTHKEKLDSSRQVRLKNLKRVRYFL